MNHNDLLSEPQKGIEPLTARLGNVASGPSSYGDNANTTQVLRASTPEVAPKTLQSERTESERPSSGGIAGLRRLKSTGPDRVGHITEASLAARWGRAPNTLVGWRTRPLPDRNRLRYDVIGGTVYFDWLDVLAFEADPANAWVRPVEQRDTPLPDPDRHQLTLVQRVNLQAKRTPATPTEDGLAFLRVDASMRPPVVASASSAVTNPTGLPALIPISEQTLPAIAREVVAKRAGSGSIEITPEGRRILEETRGSGTAVSVSAPRYMVAVELVRATEPVASLAVATADDGTFWVVPAAALLQSPIPWRQIDPVITEAAA